MGIEKGEIIPQEDWQETLIGTWHLEFTQKKLTEILNVHGTATFKSNSTYIYELKFDYYASLAPGEVKVDLDYMRRKGKVIFYSNYSLSDYYGYSVIQLDTHTKDCSTNDTYKKLIGYDLDMCVVLFDLINVIGTGDDQYGRKYELIKFSENEIIQRAEDFFSDNFVTITFKRVLN